MKYKTPSHLVSNPARSCWQAMKCRCRNKNGQAYKNYGGRGISICDRWNSFENFLHDLGERPSFVHSLERIDNDGNYEPGNVRWATAKEQANNKRDNVFICWKGETKTLSQWSETLGIGITTILYRLRSGLSIDQVLGEKATLGRVFNRITARQIADSLGLKYETYVARKKRGWSPEKIASTPTLRCGGNNKRTEKKA